MRRLAKLLPYLAIAVVLLIAGSYFLYIGPLQTRLRATLLRELEARTGLRATAGRIDLRAGRVTLHDLTLTQPDGTRLLEAPEITVLLGDGGFPRSLAQLRRIREVRLLRPTVRLVRGKNGVLNISSLLKARPKGAPSFTGRVTVQQGTLVFVDQTQGGATTALHQLDLSYTAAGARPAPFTLTAVGEKDSFTSVRATGEYDPTTNLTRLELSLPDVSVPFALRRLPPLRGIKISGGRAAVSGTVRFGPDERGRARVLPDLRVQPRQATVAFPWLRQPLTGVAGELRLTAREARLTRITGSLGGAPIQAGGTIGNFAKPVVNIDFSVARMPAERLLALVPDVTLPDTIKVAGPVQVRGSVRGTPPDITVSGRAAVPSLTLACLPWHDVVANFLWQRRQFSITQLRAHGSPRRLEGDVNVLLQPGQTHARANVVMREVPVSLLAACLPELKRLDAGGLATITVAAEINRGLGMTGSFVVRNGRYGKYALGNVRGDFALVGQQSVRVTNARLAGPTATGDFSVTADRTGRFSLTAQLAAVNLRALGLAGLTGTARGPLKVNGNITKGQVQGHADLALAGVAGGALRGLSTDFALRGTELALTHLTLQPRTGRATGQLTVRNWRQGKQARLAGQFEVTDVPVRDWLPANLAATVPQAQATGTVTLAGTPTFPRVVADLQLAAVQVPQAGAVGTGHVRVSYDAGRVQLDQFTFESPQGRLEVRGEYSRLRGLDLTIPEARTDLSLLSPYVTASLGLSLSGPAVVSASVQGRPENPNVDFRVQSPRAKVDGVVLEDLALVGRLRNGLLTLEQANFREGTGTVSLTGTYHLRTGQMNLQATAQDIDVAVASPWLRRHLGLAGQGRVNASLAVAGALPLPQVQFTISSPALTVNEVRFQDVYLQGQSQGATLTLTRVQFRQDLGQLTLAGPVNLLTRQLNLKLTLQDMDIYNLTLVFARAAARLQYFHTTSRPMQFYASLPGPLRGTLDATATITGTYDNPQAQARVALANLAYDGRTLDHVGGDFSIAAQQGKLRTIGVALEATEEDASASVNGQVVIGGEVSLRGDVNNLSLQLLAPWFRGATTPTGQASVSFDVSGRTDDPLLVGSLSVDNFAWGPLRFEAALIAPVRLQRRLLRVEGILLRQGPAQGTGTAQVVLPPRGQPWTAAALLSQARAELHLRDGRFAPLAGMTPAQFDADVFLLGRRLLVRNSPQEMPGPAVPGIRGRLGKGNFTVAGEVLLPERLTLESLPYSVANLQADLDPLDLDLPGFIDAQLAGRLLLDNDPTTGRMRLATAAGQPLIVSHGSLGAPEAGLPPSAPFVLPAPPSLDLTVVAGPDLTFRYSPVQAAVSRATLHLTGRFTPADVVLQGEAESTQGRLNFPNARLNLAHARVAIAREAGKALTVRIVDSEATGQVGDYELIMNPSGQIYPLVCTEPGCVPLDLNARSTPFLDTPYIMALLMGPVISPESAGVGLDPLAVLSAARRPTSTAGTITGVMIPTFFGQSVALDYSFEGPLALRLRQRLFGRLSAQYITPLTGPGPENNRLVLTYPVTPRYSLGWSINGLSQSRWQLQSFFDF